MLPVLVSLVFERISRGPFAVPACYRISGSSYGVGSKCLGAFLRMSVLLDMVYEASQLRNSSVRSSFHVRFGGEDINRFDGIDRCDAFVVTVILPLDPVIGVFVIGILCSIWERQLHQVL